MVSFCCYTDTTVTTREAPNHSWCLLDEARAAASEALADLAATDLCRHGDARQRPEYWVGHLQYLLGYVLIALEQAER